MNLSDIKYIAIHCAATPPHVNVGAVEITRWHKARGWSDIGYHYVIRRNGVIEKGGRMMDERGAHVKGFNNVSIGICLVGGVDAHQMAEDNFTDDQFRALKELLRELRLIFPKAIIQGHRDFPDVRKACPSFEVKDWLEKEGIE